MRITIGRADVLRGFPALLLGAVLVLTACATPSTRAVVRGGPLFVGGDLRASEGPASARATADALGLDSEPAIQPRIDVDWPDWHVSVQGFGVDFSGDGIADGRLEGPGGGAIERGVAVRSRLSVEMITADVAFDVIPLEFMDVGVGAGLGYLSFDVSATAKAAPVTVGLDESTPVGYLLLRLAKQADDFGGVLRIAGISASFENDTIRYFEADLMGTVRLWGAPGELRGELVLGYRYLSADYDHRSGTYRFETSPVLQGPYLGLALVF